jgi:hypothetical protein
MGRTKFTNQFRRSRNRYPGAAGGLLDNMQKARICILARSAFERLGSGGVPPSNYADWRREEQFKAVGKLSLRHCLQSDYLSLVAHFQALAGDTDRAFNTHLRDSLQEKEIARYKLEEACEERGLNLSYPGVICRRQFKCELDQANAKQLWNLVFTVKNRRRVAADEKKTPIEPMDRMDRERSAADCPF